MSFDLSYEQKLQESLRKKKKRKAVAGGPWKPLNLLRNFLHQGFFYMDRTEKLMRILWELVPFGILLWAVKCISPELLHHWITWILSLAVVHLLNWIFNDNFRVCWIFSFPWAKNPSELKTIEYLNSLNNRLRKYSSITGIMLYGSISRGEWHSRSDIDMRILRAPGFWNGVTAYCLTSRERMIAFFKLQPLDVYLADGLPALAKMRKDESPLFLLRRDSRLSEYFPDVQETTLIELAS